MKRLYLLIILLFLSILGGCSNHSLHPTAEIIIGVENLVLSVDETYVLSPSVIYAESALEFGYQSSDKSIATVTNGIIVAKAEGQVEISVYLLAYTKTKAVLTVTVTGEDSNFIINIFSLNDFHGAVFADDDEPGISKIGKYLIAQKTSFPESTIIISAGDMFQGGAVSSLTRGKVVVEAMNEIGFDALTIGNHEFDWGIDNITRYADKDLSNGEAEFPLLGANIFQKSANDLAYWTKPYAVVQRNGIKIGIIGTLGERQTTDILASIVADYEFTSQLEAIRKYTKQLRNEEGCDIVIVSSHDNTSSINPQIASMTGEYYVDAIINGHTHSYYAGEVARASGTPMPYVQSGDNGRYIGKISLFLDPNTKAVIDVSAENINAYNTCQEESSVINAIINNYPQEIAIASEVLGNAGETIYREQATSWAATAIKTHGLGEVGVINSGGIRSSAFPIYEDSTVTYGNIFKMMPFENRVITLELTGYQLMNLFGSGLRFSSNVDTYNNTIDDVAIDGIKVYKVVTMDFVFEGYSGYFMQANNVLYTDDLFRDYLVQEVKDSIIKNGKWYLE